MDDEARAKLIEQTEAYRLIDETIKTPGWQNIIIPRIDKLKEDADIILINSTNYRDIMRAQEKVKAIDSVLIDLGVAHKDGEEAVEILANEKEKEE